MINISKLSKPQVLAALYNASHAQGMGFWNSDPVPMSEEEAAKILERQTDFEYLKGRVMKVDLSGTEFDPWLYDRDCGEGAAQRAVSGLTLHAPDRIESGEKI
jgi:hypothetical protein